MKITDEAVEAAAEAIYYERQALNPGSPRWSHLAEGDESEKDWYRDEARSALVAALPFLSVEEVTL